MRHTREKVKSILVNWWKKPRFNSHLATISHDKNVYIYIYRLLDDVNCSNEFDSHSPLGARAYAVRYNKPYLFVFPQICQTYRN